MRRESLQVVEYGSEVIKREDRGINKSLGHIVQNARY